MRVGTARLLVFIVAAAGCGAAGGILAIEQLQVVPGTSGGVFSVQWTAVMAFAVIIGGIGTIEGPIVGTIVYMVLQQTLQSYNVWYLIVLGIVAIVIAIFARRGLWGLLDERFNIRLFPVGYHLWAPDERRGRRRAAAPAASLDSAARSRLTRARPSGQLHQGRQWLTCCSLNWLTCRGLSLRRRLGSPRLRRLLTRCAPRASAEIPVVVAYLPGELPQRQIGVGWAALRSVPAPAEASSLTVLAVDEAFTRIGAIAGGVRG